MPHFPKKIWDDLEEYVKTTRGDSNGLSYQARIDAVNMTYENRRAALIARHRRRVRQIKFTSVALKAIMAFALVFGLVAVC